MLSSPIKEKNIDQLKLFKWERRKWKNLFGRVEEHFKLMFWGSPGNQKSRLTARLVGDEFVKKGKVLWIAAEESTALVRERFRRFRINSKDILILPQENCEISLIKQEIIEGEFDFAVWDSIQYIRSDRQKSGEATQKEIRKVCSDIKQIKKMTHVYIFHALKSKENYKGETITEHDSDVVSKLSNGSITVTKSKLSMLKTEEIRKFLC